MPLLILVGIALLVWLPFRRSVTGRTVYAIGSAEGAAYMSGLPIARAKIAAFTLAGFFAACGGLYLAIQTSSGNADVTQAGAYTLNSIAAVVLGGTSLLGGIGGAIGSLIGALILRVISFYFRILVDRPAAAAADRGRRAARRRQPRRASARSASGTASSCSDDHASPASAPRTGRSPSPPASSLVILALGTAYTLSSQGTAPLLSPDYLLQQLQIGAFLGIVAAGMMMVILLGHIDLSVPWTLTAAAMMATTVGGPLGDPRRPRRRPRSSASSTASASRCCASRR